MLATCFSYIRMENKQTYLLKKGILQKLTYILYVCIAPYIML